MDNTTPTVVWEVAYSETERKLALDAARHICLSLGLVQLVVAVKIEHCDSFPKRLERVTWSHWELVDAEPVAEWGGALDDPQPFGWDAVTNHDFVPPIGTKYQAVVKIGSALQRVTAEQTQTHQVLIIFSVSRNANT
jgi:hypothetical protein